MQKSWGGHTKEMQRDRMRKEIGKAGNSRGGEGRGEEEKNSRTQERGEGRVDAGQTLLQGTVAHQ